MIKKISSINSEELIRINNFLEKCTFAEYYQDYNWSLIRNEEVKYYLYSEDEFNNIDWVCSLFEKVFDEEKVLYAPRGPVLDYTNKNNIERFLREINKWIIEMGYKKLIINPVVKSNYLKDLETKYKYEVTKSDNYRKLFDSCKLAIMDIVFDEEELLSKLPPRFRQNIRRSYRKDLTYKTNKKIDLNNFYELYLQTSERHDFKPHMKKYFEELLKIYEDDIVCFEVWYKNIPLAMSIDFIYKNKLIYLYGVSSTANRNLLGMYSLQWESIKYCINNKIEMYDFGGVFCKEDETSNKDYGLYTFKKGFCYKGFIDILPDVVFDFSNNEEVN